MRRRRLPRVARTAAIHSQETNARPGVRASSPTGNQEVPLAAVAERLDVGSRSLGRLPDAPPHAEGSAATIARQDRSQMGVRVDSTPGATPPPGRSASCGRLARSRPRWSSAARGPHRSPPRGSARSRSTDACRARTGPRRRLRRRPRGAPTAAGRQEQRHEHRPPRARTAVRAARPPAVPGKRIAPTVTSSDPNMFGLPVGLNSPDHASNPPSGREGDDRAAAGPAKRVSEREQAVAS